MPEKPRHNLVPVHEKLSDKERAELLKKYNVSLRELPKILPSDPAVQGIDVKEGDVVRVIRKSHTADESFYYRGVTNG